MVFGGVAVVVVVALIAAAVILPRLFGGSDGGGDDLEFVGLPVRFPGPTSEPEEQWSESLDCEDVSDCNLAANDDNAFVALVDFNDDGDVTTEVTAYAAASGDERWSELFDGAPELRSVEQGLVVSGVEDGDEVLLLDADSGEEQWSTTGSFAGEHDGDLIIRDGGESSLVDAGDGEEILTVDGFLFSCGPGALVRSEDNEFIRVDDGNGEDLWGRVVDGGPRFGCDDDALALIDDDEVITVRLSDGEEQATGDANADASGVIVDAGFVLLLGNLEGVGYQASGDELDETWTADVPEAPVGVLLEGGEVLLIGSRAAEIVSLADGESRGRARLGRSSPILTTESLVTVSDDSATAFDLGDLEDRWEIDFDDAREAAVGGDRLFILAGDDLLSYG